MLARIRPVSPSVKITSITCGRQHAAAACSLTRKMYRILSSQLALPSQTNGNHVGDIIRSVATLVRGAQGEPDLAAALLALPGLNFLRLTNNKVLPTVQQPTSSTAAASAGGVLQDSHAPSQQNMATQHMATGASQTAAWISCAS